MPLGYEKIEKCYKLKKVLYRLKQSHRSWFEILKIVMKSMGYKDNFDHTLLIKHDEEKVTIFLIYVDDIVIIGGNEDKRIRLKMELFNEFDLILGKLRFFLSVARMNRRKRRERDSSKPKTHNYIIMP